jgi:FixJ family two-component response regulator
MTGYGSADVHARAMRLGAGVVIDKPFAFATLQMALREVA